MNIHINNLHGRIIFNRISITNNYTVLITDYLIGCDTNENSITITLPSASTTEIGQNIYIKDEGRNATNNNITIIPDGTDTIEGEISISIIFNGESYSLYSNGVDQWFIY